MKLKVYKWGILLICLLVFISISQDSFAQCAMCKASATSNMESNANDIGKGLNSGILYLMTVPYIILASIFFFAFKKQIIARFKAFRK